MGVRIVIDSIAGYNQADGRHVQRSCVECVGMAKPHNFELFTLEVKGIAFEDFRKCQLRRNLAREVRLPIRFKKVRLNLLLHRRYGRSRGERSGIGESVEQELQTKEMIAVAMRDVNGCEMLAALGEPIGEFLRMLN